MIGATMQNDSLDYLLSQSRPVTAADRPNVEGPVLEVVAMSRAVALQETPAPRWSRVKKAVLIGGVSAAALGLTAGAVLTFLPGSYEVATEVSFAYPINPFDVTIGQGPIECVATVQFDQLPDQAAKQQIEQFVTAHDWSTLGDAVYAQAEQIPEQSGDGTLVDPFIEALDDQFRLVFEEELADEGRYIGVAATCNGGNS